MHKINRPFVISASFFLVLLAAMASPAQTLTTILNFNLRDGADPPAAPIQATDGYLYGTTNGGASTGYGTVFKMSTEGTLTTLYVFCSQPGCADGAEPDAGLVQGVDGNLYGTTLSGGANFEGAVFKITPGGTLTTLYSFCSLACADGYEPEAALVQGADGNFYGTTSEGGAGGQGTVFKITPGGALTTLYSFCSESNCTDGAQPLSGLIEGTDGSFYGTTYSGGANNYGTIYRITPSGALTILHSFNLTDGAYPWAGLVHATNGSFYGTTVDGGQNGTGTVFRITPAGELTTIYSFCSQGGECPDGTLPRAALIQATDGSLYGTTWGGGSNDKGTAFRIDLNGALRTLHRFCSLPNCADGSQIVAGLVQDTDGNLYGTTWSGGAYGAGTIFSLSVRLGPFVETRPTRGMAGKRVEILGTDLTGTTSVTFNGTPATFTVVSPSLITTTIPAGATTGAVQVATPGGTLSSNVPFRVIP